MDALPFLARKATSLEPLYVLAGDEAFLKRLVLRRLRELALGDDPDDSAVTVVSGASADFAAVFDELESLPFFSPKRVVIIDSADPFVTEYRDLLEKKFSAKSLPATGLLALDVKSWPANTRLAKMVDDKSTITCKAPAAYKMPQWACEWAASQYQKNLALPAGQLLVDLIGVEMGVLDQELMKLATYVGDRDKILPDDVDRLVGNSREEKAWAIFDLIGQGNTAAALRFLQRQLEQGEDPQAILGMCGKTIRQLAAAARLITSQKLPMSAALQQAGVLPFGMKNAEAVLRHLSRARALKLFDWLLELHLDLRGNSQLDKSTLLERFFLRLASKAG